MALRIAVACSGLGHVARGVEAWAEDLARGLHEAGADLTLFRGAGPCEPWAEVIPCMKRFDANTAAVARFFRHIGGWRYGFGSTADVEQTIFSYGLWRRIRSNFDVLHVQDAWIGRHLTMLHHLKLSRPRVVIGNGTGEGSGTLRKYDYLQHLTPAQMEHWETYRRPGQQAFLIPNFVDTGGYRPASRAEARQRWGLPQDAFIVLAVAALRKRFKRIDYLIREFRTFADQYPRPCMLVLAGGREDETDELIALGKELLGERVRFLENVPRKDMSSLYPAADLFTIPALDEVFGIAFIEAMACGLPVAANDTPVMRWVSGPAGRLGNFQDAGGLARLLVELSSSETRERAARAARPYVEENFSLRSVVSRMLEMYQAIAPGHAG